MHLDREDVARVEELEQEWKSLESAGPCSQHLLRRLFEQLPDGRSFERSIGHSTGMLVAVAEEPGFANRLVARQRRGEQFCQPPAAPEPVLVDRIKSQRVKRYSAHNRSI